MTAVVGHLLGYARVSTAQQDPALQLDALHAAGCARLWTDYASGARSQRPQLQDLLERLLPGDTLVVWRLDRLGRSIADLIANRADAQAARRRFAQPAGEHRHHDRWRPAHLSHLRRARRV